MTPSQSPQSTVPSRSIRWLPIALAGALVASLFTLVVPTPARAAGTETINGITYTADSFGARVITYNPAAADSMGLEPVIPDTVVVGGITYPVFLISDNAFVSKGLTSVTIGNSVEFIGRTAFAGNNLTSLTLGSSVSHISSHAFWGNNLTEVTIPASMTFIDELAFTQNPALSSVIFEGNAPAIWPASPAGSFDQFAPDKVMYFRDGAVGFTTPTWAGYSSMRMVAPGAPMGLAATAGNAQVELLWTAPAANGGSAITDYQVEVSEDGTNWVVFNDGVSTGTTATVTGLTNGTEYSFRVSALNSIGTGAVSNVATATPVAPAPPVPPAPPAPPAAPSGVTIGGGLLQAQVSWVRSTDDNGDGSVTYSVTVTQGSNTFTCTTTGTFCAVTGLAPGTFTVSVTATNADGSSTLATSSGTALALTDVPNTPPADQGGGSVEFRDQSGRVVTEVAPGQTLTVVTSGFAPLSVIDVFVYSTPQHLGRGVTDATGAATFQVAVPSNLAVGTHTLVAMGLNSGGATATAAITVNVTNLPNTGGASTAPLLIVGGLLLALSAAALLRRRRADA